MYCKKCGCSISEDAVFCKKCGEKQHQGIESAAVHSHQGKDFLKKFSVVFRRVFRTTASKIIAGVLAVAIFATGVVIVVDNQNKNRFSSDNISVLVEPTLKYDDVMYFSEGFAGVEKDGKWGYVDQTGKEVVPLIYDEVEAFNDGLARVEKDGKWGCVDQTGKEVVSPQYDEIGLFHEGLARVKNYSEYGGRYGYIDKTGKAVVPLKYDEIGDFKDGLAVARIGKASSGDWKYGYIDKTGKEVVPFIYRGAGDFNEGLAYVQKDGRYGYIDKTGNIVIPLNFTSAIDFSDGLAVVGYGNNIWYIIDKTCDIKNTKELLTQYTNVTGFKEGFVNVFKDGKHGFVDQTGKEVVPPKYDIAFEFNEGLAIVEKDGKWGCVDQTGKEVVSTKYDDIGGFNEEGLARVEKDGKRGYIDQAGKEVVPLKYDTTYGFNEGLASVEKDGKWGYVDQSGNEIISLSYDYTSDFDEGFAWVKKDKKCGYIDKTGKEVVPFIYDDAQNFSEGLAWVRKGKKWGILKINEPTSNDPSSTTTSDVPTTSSSTDTSATAINIDDYVGMWHIDGQNYDSNYVAAYETELGIEKLSNNKFSFWLIREHKYEISCETTLNGNMADFTCEDGQYIVIGTLTFNQNSITVNITSSDMPYNPVGTITFDSRHGGIYDDGRGDNETNDPDSTCPRCGRTLTDGETCDCTWCDICNAWMLGHGHGEGEELVDSDTAHSGTGSTADYDYSFEGNEITITKYKGSGDTVVIPATIDGKRVTVIGGTAFSERFDLTSVTIPASVISIRDRSFDFSHFESIYFEGNAPSLEDYAWEKLNCMWDVFYYKPGTTGWTSPPWDAYDKETW